VGEEKLSEDIDQLFELTKIMVLVLTGLIPNLTNTKSQGTKDMRVVNAIANYISPPRSLRRSYGSAATVSISSRGRSRCLPFRHQD
jgi:hypothetical protein